MMPRSVTERLFSLSWIVCLTAGVLVLATPARAIQIARISSDKIYIEPGTDNRGMYVGYEITNDGAMSVDDVWVTLDNFIGVVVTPAPGESAKYRIGTLAPGEAKPAYLYLQANGTTLLPQTHDVNVRIGSDTSPPVATEPFPYIVEESIEASPNQVVPVISMPDGPVVGGVLEITVTGQTGGLPLPAELALSPATDVNWPAGAFRLTNVSTLLWSQGDGCIALVSNVNGSMIIATPADAVGYCYESVYEFRIADTTPASTAVSPRQYINSGQQIKHESLDCTGGFCTVPTIMVLTPTQLLPIDAARLADTTPTMTYVSYPFGDAELIDVHYRIQWDTDPSFASALGASSDIDPGFENKDTPADLPPFQQGDRVGYTFPPLTDGTTHWWRVSVRADDSTDWSEWSPPRSFTINNAVAPAPPLADWHMSTEEQFLTITLENATTDGDALVIADQSMPGTAQTPLIALGDLHTEPGTSFSLWKEVVVSADLPDAATSVSLSAFDDNDNLLAGPAVGTGPNVGDIQLDLSGHAESHIYVKITMTPGSTPHVTSITMQGDDAFTVPTRVRSFLARPMGTVVELVWVILSDGESPQGYRMYRRSRNETFVDLAGLLPVDTRSLRDTTVLPGRSYTYRLVVVEADGTQSILAATEVQLPPLSISLGQNVPNPFNPSTRISFTTDRTAHVTLAIYTVTGVHVATLVDDTRPAGRWWAEWNGTDAGGQTVASGVYYYQLRVDGQRRVHKMVMIR